MVKINFKLNLLTKKTMTKTDILIIGGGPAGLVAAVTARKNNPDKKNYFSKGV